MGDPEHINDAGLTRVVNALLDVLLAEHQLTTLHQLAQRVGCDVATCGQGIERLREEGCGFDEHPQWGVRLTQSGLGCWRDYLERRESGGLQKNVRVYQATESTQDVAHRLIGSGGEDGCDMCVVLADQQSAGRGRLGRRWVSQAGDAVLMTVAMNSAGMAGDYWMLAGCVTVAKVLEKYLGEGVVRIKWPNDLYLGDGKVAGMLTEQVRVGEQGWVLLGVGINVGSHPGELAGKRASSLGGVGVAGVDRLRIIAEIVAGLEEAKREPEPVEWHGYWQERSLLIGKTVKVEASGERYAGRVVDLDVERGLLVALERGQVVHLPAATSTILLVGEGG